MARVCVYCGSIQAVPAIYHDAAREMGQAMVRRGLDLVYGGGRLGLMGTVADAILEGGGRVYGVIPKALQDLELGHQGATELLVVQDMHTRKSIMASLADAFVALPGGIGTLEELFEMMTWTSLGFQDKNVGVLNAGGFYDDILRFLARIGDEGFLRQRDLLKVADEADALLDQLLTAPPR